MAYFQYNIFVTIAGILSYLVFSVCGPCHFAHAQSASSAQCVKALNEAKEICTRQPQLSITPPASGAGIAETARAQFNDAFINEVRLAVMAKECDKAINICAFSALKQVARVEGLQTDRSTPAAPLDLLSFSSYYEVYLGKS